MALEITVGPPQLAINEGHVVMVTDPDGQIATPVTKGLYFYDTRLISSWPYLPMACPGTCSTAAT